VKSLIQVFEDQKIRTLFDEEKQEWYFSVVDVCGALSESLNPSNYWKVLKNRLNKQENQLVTNCNQLKMLASDGKMRITDALRTKDVLRLVQEIPSKKAKQFRIWVAKVAVEKIAEKRQAKLATTDESETPDEIKMIPAPPARKKRKIKKLLLFLIPPALLAVILILVLVLATSA